MNDMKLIKKEITLPYFKYAVWRGSDGWDYDACPCDWAYLCCYLLFIFYV